MQLQLLNNHSKKHPGGGGRRWTHQLLGGFKVIKVSSHHPHISTYALEELKR